MEPVAASLENEKVCMYNNSHHVCTSGIYYLHVYYVEY